MKITLLHGLGEVAKRNQLSQIKKGFAADAVTILDFKQAGLSQIKMMISSGSLFADKRLVVVENTPDDCDVAELVSSDISVELVLVAGSPSATKPLIKSAQQQKIMVLHFDGEKEVSAFPFLDALLEKRPEAYTELEKLLEEYGEMYVLTMMYYALRRNLLPLPASDFAKKKIIQQKKLYQTDDFARMYKQALELEHGFKTGSLEPHAALTSLIADYFSATPQ